MKWGQRRAKKKYDINKKKIQEHQTKINKSKSDIKALKKNKYKSKAFTDYFRPGAKDLLNYKKPTPAMKEAYESIMYMHKGRIEQGKYAVDQLLKKNEKLKTKYSL